MASDDGDVGGSEVASVTAAVETTIAVSQDAVEGVVVTAKVMNKIMAFTAVRGRDWRRWWLANGKRRWLVLVGVEWHRRQQRGRQR